MSKAQQQPQTAYAVLYLNEDGTLRGTIPGSTPECGVRGANPLEGQNVFGFATIRVEPEPISGMRFVLREVGPKAEPEVLAEPPAPPTESNGGEEFVDWLTREMPRGTIIGDPLWWSSRIARAYELAHRGRASTPVAPAVHALPKKWRDEAAFDGYMTGISRIDEATANRAAAKCECADELEAALPSERNEDHERCESGSSSCGPVEFHDVEGVPLCQKCWDSLAVETQEERSGG